MFSKGRDVPMKFDGAAVYTFAPMILPVEFWDSTGGPFTVCNMSHLVELYESSGIVGTMICTERMAKVVLPHILTGETKTAGEWLDIVFWKNRNNGFMSESAYEYGRFEFLIYDILSKMADEPLHRYLGAQKDWIHAYGSGAGVNLTDRQMVDEIEDFLKDGYKTVKMKIAGNFGADLDNDLRRIALVRKTIGKDIKLAIDGNQYFQKEAALEFIKKAAEYDIAWFEEPLHCCDFEGMKWLAEKSPVPIAAGESMRNHYMFEQYLRCGVKHFQPCPSNMAGIREWMLIRDMAQENQIQLTSGGLPYMAGPLIATADETAMEEYLKPVENAQREFLSIKWDIKDGKFYMPMTPGIPFKVDLERMRKKQMILRKDYYYPGDFK